MYIICLCLIGYPETAAGDRQDLPDSQYQVSGTRERKHAETGCQLPEGYYHTVQRGESIMSRVNLPGIYFNSKKKVHN